MKIRSLQIFMVVIIALMLIAPIVLSASDEDGDEDSVAKMSSTKIKNVFKLKSCGKLNIENGYYKLVKDVSSKGTCFKIMANNITLDGQGHTIKHSKKMVGYGVYSYNPYDTFRKVVIKNIVITDSKKYSRKLNGDAIHLNGKFSDSIIRNNSITLYKEGGSAIYLTKYDPYPYDMSFKEKANYNIYENYILLKSDASTGIYVNTVGGFNLIYKNVINTDSLSNLLLIVGTSYNNVSDNRLSSVGSNFVYDGAIVRGGTAIFFLGSINNTVGYNSLFSAGTGVLLFYSSGNVFFNNSIDTITNNSITLITDASNRYAHSNSFIGNTIFRGNSSTFRNNTDLYFYDRNNNFNQTKLVDYSFEKYHFGNKGFLIEFEQTNYGKIDFTQGVTGSGNNLSAEIQILNNTALINSTINPGLNRSANITFYHMSGWGFTDNAKIYRDGQICGRCHNFTPLTADTIVFNVSGAGRYEIR